MLYIQFNTYLIIIPRVTVKIESRISTSGFSLEATMDSSELSQHVKENQVGRINNVIHCQCSITAHDTNSINDAYTFNTTQRTCACIMKVNRK